MQINKEKLKKYSAKAAKTVGKVALWWTSGVALGMLFEAIFPNSGNDEQDDYWIYDDDDFSSSNSYEYEDVYEEYDYDNDEYDLDWEDDCDC